MTGALKVRVSRKDANKEAAGCQGCRAMPRYVTEAPRNKGKGLKAIDTIIELDVYKDHKHGEVGLFSLRLCDGCWVNFRSDFVCQSVVLDLPRSDSDD